MPDPLLILLWAVLAVAATAYTGAAARLWWDWRPHQALWWQHVLVAALALVWPWAVGAAAVERLKDIV